MERSLAAWNWHQPERLLELMTEDIVYGDSGSSQTMRGRAQQRRRRASATRWGCRLNARVAISVARCRASGVTPMLPPTTRLVDYLGVIDGRTLGH